MSPILQLIYDSVEAGNCRVYFWGQDHHIYCWQVDSADPIRFVLFSCSDDGEPEAPVPDTQPTNTHLPDDIIRESDLARLLSQFLGYAPHPEEAQP